MKALATTTLVILFAAAASGCTYKTVEGPLAVTTKPDPSFAVPAGAKEVLGSSCSRNVLLIIPVGFATADAAYEDALAQAPGADTLVNFEGRADHLFIFPFYFEVCAQVHGWAVSSSQLTAEAETKADADAYVGYWAARWTERPATGAWSPAPIAPPKLASIADGGEPIE